MAENYTWGNWGNQPMPQMQLPQLQIPNATSPFLPQLAGNYTNSMDQASDAFVTSGLPNAGGFQFGQTAANLPAQGGGILANFLDKKDTPGWGGMAMNTLGGLASAFMSMENYGLAKYTLDQHKQEYAANYAAQRSITNASMEDRQRALIGSSGGTNANYQSVSDYMAKNGIK